MAQRATTIGQGARQQQKQHKSSSFLAALLAIRYVQQAAILTWKNLLVAWRNRRATLLRLSAPFVFLLLALLIQLALDANNKRQERIREVDPPPYLPINPIPSCHDDLYIAGKPCVNFLYSPANNTLVQDIIANIRLRNPPAMTEDQVLGFPSRAAAEDWMASNPEGTLGAVHFVVDSAATPPSIQYSIQTNTTTKAFKGNFQSPVTFFTMPLASAVAREVSRVQLAAAGGDPEALAWQPQLVPFPHPQLRSIGMVGYVLGPFIFAACMFGMVMQLGAVVGEKEVGLVTVLRLMGLRQLAYWTSWVVADLLLGFLTALSIVIWGLVMQFRFFLRNDFGLLLLLFWLLTLALSSFSYFLSVFMRRAQSATYTGFAVFLVGWICQTVIVFGVPYDPETYFAPSGVGRTFFWIFALLPWCPLSKATQDLAAATNSDKSPGLRWSERESYCRYIPDSSQWPPVDPTQQFVDFTCIFPISQCYLTLILQAVGWLVLAVYLDNVLPGENKRARAPYYFLLPSYWVRPKGAACGLSGRQQQQLLQAAAASQQQRQQQQGDASLDMSGGYGSNGSSGSSIDAEVAAEEAAMQALLQELLPAAAGAGGAAAIAGVGVVGALGPAPSLKSTPSWPQLQVHSVSQQHGGGSGGSSAGSGTDADCQVADGDAASEKGGSSSNGSTGSGWDFAGYALAVFGLRKVFKAGCGAAGCCGKGGARDFHALAGVWLGIRPGQLFALLGPNGAGKTTLIKSCTGLLPPSGGEILLCGQSILSEGGLDRATGLIGVCPQFDVLWGELTGSEHLLVAGHVKGLPWAQVSGAASELLSRVQLSCARGVRSGSYSGGMKRRLSVAVALVGDPKVLFLDEPTTGMDPISRRAVWDVIQDAKQGRAVVLTTHSMEEADVLGDRIGIVARGRLCALGSSIRLKQKFGTGYQCLVSLLHDKQQSGGGNSGGGSSRQTSGGLRHRHTGSAGKQGSGSATAAAAAAAAAAAGPGSPRSAAVVGAVSGAAPAAAAAARDAVKALFASHLGGLAPAEENRRSLQFLVPRAQQQQLVGLLQQLEAAMAAAAAVGGGSSDGSRAAAVGVVGEEGVRALRRGVADVSLSLTSLEEVFLSIAKQAELEASAESGATVTITLPDTAQQLQVAVGQEWVQVDALGGGAQQAAGLAGSRSASSRGGGQLALSVSGNGAAAVRSYFLKWAQDETGALAVSEVVPVAAAAARHQHQHQQQQQVAAVSSQAGGLAAVAPVAG